MTAQPSIRVIHRCAYCGGFVFPEQDVKRIKQTGAVIHPLCWETFAERELGADHGYFIGAHTFQTKGKSYAVRPERWSLDQGSEPSHRAGNPKQQVPVSQRTAKPGSRSVLGRVVAEGRKLVRG